MNLKFVFAVLFPVATVWADKFPKPYKNSFEKDSDVSYDDNFPQGDAFFFVKKVAAKNRTPNKATDGKYYALVPRGSFVAGDDSFVRYGGYNTVEFPRYGYTTSIDIYLDKTKVSFPNQPNPPIQVFEYSSAISQRNGNHLRDFIFHVGTASDGNFVVTADNNGMQPDPSVFPSGPILTITESGWYTFKHNFHDKGDDTLEVTLSVHKPGVTTPLGGVEWDRNTSADIVSTIVAGNRYGWFVYNAIGNLPIDNVTRSGGAIVTQASECTGNGYLTVFKKDYKPFTSQKECTDYLKKKLRD